VLNFIATVFKGFYSFFLWINLIVCTIGGGIVGEFVYDHPILGGIIGLVIGFLSNILGGGIVAIFLRIDENLKILIILNGGRPIDERTEIDRYTEKQQIIMESVSLNMTHTVTKDTNLNDSLSLYPKIYRTLKNGEKVKIQNIIDRQCDLGGVWALIETETKEEGWCLLDALSENK
jgi:hypothetical protein